MIVVNRLLSLKRNNFTKAGSSGLAINSSVMVHRETKKLQNPRAFGDIKGQKYLRNSLSRFADCAFEFSATLARVIVDHHKSQNVKQELRNFSKE